MPKQFPQSLHQIIPNLVEIIANGVLKPDRPWSEMTLNYCMMVEWYPKLQEEVGGSIPGCEISSLFDIFLAMAYRLSV